MAVGAGTFRGLPEVYTSSGTSSFVEFLSVAAPHLLPGRTPLPPGDLSGLVPHGTTIVAATFAGGVVMAGDRRATAGNMIASRDVEKVFPADAYSVVGIAGTAGLASEMIRLFQVELEHYEKIEGNTLTFDGKANRLGTMIRGNLGAALQGLAVIPLFAGFDQDAPDPSHAGRIVSFDIAGSRQDERQFDAIGSGSIFARNALKKRYREGGTADEAVRLCLDALYDAADDDSATGGPDLARRIFPIVAVVTTAGVQELTGAEVGTVVEQVVADRMANPGG